MPHLKKDFKYHKIFDNKYVNQTYYAYLYRNNKPFIPRGDSFLPYHAYIVNDFIIYCNNNICRRGSIENSKEKIKKDFEYIKKQRFYLSLDTYYSYPSDKNNEGDLIAIAELIESDKNNNPTRKRQAELIRKVYYWYDNFEKDFDGFKEFIYDEIKFFDEQHYDWIKEEDFIYNRSIRDNEKKRVYCVINGEQTNNKFKKIYFNNVSVEPKYKGTLYKQISYMLINIADINNLFVNKEFEKAKELMNDYIDDNMNMSSCYDIYYRKVFENICDIVDNYNKKNDSHYAFNEIQKIIAKENEKYKNDIILFKEVAIDLSKNEYSYIIGI